eukprot:CAMPEP_0182457418 /NCGR_PEP_ID=MMETSP1319-20130603/2996_1 /TAXON_ID=172717 /ORGANISM="Bolidomonas pacifica, Strain RCC208" /LENGTH=37 /DNA_ID= /DNA_START= /DNA_END= /DNA_ORIENTATION=
MTIVQGSGNDPKKNIDCHTPLSPSHITSSSSSSCPPP